MYMTADGMTAVTQREWKKCMPCGSMFAPLLIRQNYDVLDPELDTAVAETTQLPQTATRRAVAGDSDSESSDQGETAVADLISRGTAVADD